MGRDIRAERPHLVGGLGDWLASGGFGAADVLPAAPPPEIVRIDLPIACAARWISP